MPSTVELNQADPLNGKAADSVPCISADDLRGNNQDRVIETVRRACLETGFFYIDMTRPQRRTLAAALFQMDRFFALEDSDQRKQRVLQRDGGPGWAPKYTEPAYQPGTLSSLEAFECGLVNIDGSADRDIWPQLPDFRYDVAACWSDYDALGVSVLRLLARAADIDPEFLVERCNSKALNTLRLLHYSAETPRGDDRAVGIAAHTDFECMTLLFQTAPGLELLDVHGNWLDAPVEYGRIVVLLGDMLERLTNGHFRATGHRVRNTDEQRFSIVMFFAANDGITIEPLPRFVSADRPPRYAPVTQAEHTGNELDRARKQADAIRAQKT